MGVILTFITMLFFWAVFSGKFDLFHLGMGVLAAALVTWLYHGLLFDEQGRQRGEWLGRTFRFIRYGFWLWRQIVQANFHIAALAFSPRAEHIMTPQMLRFKTILKSDFARFVLANSITLTPGTVTVRIQDDTFHVHAITRHSAGDLVPGPGEMERWVAWVLEGGAR